MFEANECKHSCCLQSRKALPMRNSGSLEMAEFHAKGITSPEKDPPRVLSAKRSAERNRKKFPRKAICKPIKGK